MPNSTERSLYRLLVIGLVVLLIFGSWVESKPTSAQNAATLELQASTQTSTSSPLSAISLNPTLVIAGQTSTINVTGTNYTTSTTAEIIGIGPVSTFFVNNSTVSIQVPSTLVAGQYYVKVSDPSNGSAISPSPFTIVQATATPTQVQPISVSHSEPLQLTSGRSSVLSVFGANFTSNSTVRLIGFGFLATTFVNSNSLTAIVPDGISSGQYTVEVNDPAGGVAQSPTGLTIIGPTALPPTQAPPPPPTIEPTPVPGQPVLYVRGFSASPTVIDPGKAALLTFEVINQGNFEAQGVAVSLDAGGKFIPANGQAGATLPNILPNGVTEVSLRIIAAVDAPAGPTSIPITFNYSDKDGKLYSSKANLSISIRKVTLAPQVLLVHYSTNPDPVEPGKPIHLQVDLQNVGNETAAQVLVRLPDETALLLPGSQGNRFSAGTLAPGGKVSLMLPLVVLPDAKAGFQTQGLVISYTQADRVQESTSAITLNIIKPISKDPLLVLASYDASTPMLKPGDQFQLTMHLQNIGKAPATNLVIAMGNSTDTTQPESTPGSQSNNTNNSSTSLNNSGTFAPLKTGGTVLVNGIAVDEGITIKQDFIVNAKVPSGVYGLPITIRYKLPDGSTAQTNLRASLVVVSPPQVQITLQNPLPTVANVGQPQTLALKITNSGKELLTLTTLSVQAQNAQITDGAESPLSPLDPSANVIITAAIVPSAEGQVKITAVLHYMDDLNREQIITKEYEMQAAVPPPPSTPVPIEITPVVETTTPQNVMQKLLFGLLGLGS